MIDTRGWVRDMIRDCQLLREFERDLMRKERPDPVKNLRIVEAINLVREHPLKDS
jgi:hypothetical protein